MAIFHRRFKAPLLRSFNRLLIQPHPQRVGYANVRWTPGGIHDQHQRACSLVFGFARFLGELRINLINHAWSANSAAHMKDSAACAATLSRSESRSGTRPHATATA